jgi:hypothetical protein
MPGGHPRTVSFTIDEMIELGKEMVEWVKENDPLHLSEWYTIEKMFTYKQWKTFILRDEFVPYYETALKIVGKKYLDKSSNVRDSISPRWQRVYFNDIREQEDADADDKADREARANKSQSMAAETALEILEKVQRKNQSINSEH